MGFIEFNFVYIFGLNPKMGMDFMGFDLDETLGYGKLRIKVNNFMGCGWELLENKI
jgi:hypothetical protein